MADLDEIMSRQGEPAPGTDTETTQQPGGGQPQPDQQQPQDDGQDDADPVAGLHKALDAERGKGRKYKENLEQVNGRFDALEQRLAGFIQAFQAQSRPQPQQAQPKTPDDLFVDPDAYIDGRFQQRIAPLDTALTEMHRFIAEQRTSPEIVAEAEKAFVTAYNAGQVHPAVAQQILAPGTNRYSAAVQWFKSVNPAADRDRLREELMAELRAEMAASQGSPPPQTQAQPGAMPTSFAGTRSAGPRTQPQWSGPKPLSELMPR